MAPQNHPSPHIFTGSWYGHVSKQTHNAMEIVASVTLESDISPMAVTFEMVKGYFRSV